MFQKKLLALVYVCHDSVYPRITLCTSFSMDNENGWYTVLSVYDVHIFSKETLSIRIYL